MTAPSGPARPSAGRRPPRRRRGLRRRPLLLGVIAVAGIAGLLLVASWVRPSLDSGGAVAVPDAHVGTAYAFDGVVCLGSGQLGARVREVEVEQVDGAVVRLVQLPEGAPPTLGFPVPEDDGAALVGRQVPPGEQDCLTRLLVVPERQGEVRPGTVRVTYGYGPGGLLRRTATLRPEASLQATRTGPDPRLADGS